MMNNKMKDLEEDQHSSKQYSNNYNITLKINLLWY